MRDVQGGMIDFVADIPPLAWPVILLPLLIVVIWLVRGVRDARRIDRE